MSFLSQFTCRGQGIALDVGTATMRVATGMQRLREHPSVTGKKPALCGGVIVDGEAAVTILKPLLAQVRTFGQTKTQVLACAPSDVSHMEQQLLIESILSSGASSVIVIPEPFAAAIGCGIDVSSPHAQMVIDIGEGVTDCAVIRAGKIQTTCAVRLGCATMRREIVCAGGAKGGKPIITDEEAEELLRTYGVAHSLIDHQSATGSEQEAIPAVEQVVEQLTTEASSFLRDMPHSLGCEIIESGIWLTGGGALIPGIRERLEAQTGIGVTLVGNPLSAVVEGARALLPYIADMNRR